MPGLMMRCIMAALGARYKDPPPTSLYLF